MNVIHLQKDDIMKVNLKMTNGIDFIPIIRDICGQSKFPKNLA